LFNPFGPFVFPLMGVVSDLNSLLNTSSISAFRKDVGADILVLLIGGPYVSTAGTTFGASPSTREGYAIVASPFAFGSRLTLPHEVGHILGARHNRMSNGGDDDANDCAHGLRFMGASGTFHQTTMTNLGLTGERIPYYSNPFVTFDGAPTGFEGSASTNTANNTRKIKNRACEVQKNNNPQQIYGQIEGPAAMCPGDNIKYTSLVTPGTVQGPSNYWWQCGWSYSTSPAGPFTLLNTNLCETWVSANLGIPGSYLYLRLTVFPNTGNTWTTTKRILIQSSCFQGGGGNLEDRSAENERELVRPELFYLMPNPAGGTVMAGTHQSDHLIEQVVIFSANGDKVLESNIAEKAVRSLTFDLAKVPSGFYYVRFITNAGVFTKVLSHIND
jgi:hypothetical protein